MSGDVDPCVRSVSSWRRAPSATKQLGAHLGPFSLLHPEGGSFIQVIAKSPPLPTAAACEKLIHHMRRYSGQLACIGTVLEGTGFSASALRSFLVGLRIVVPRTFEIESVLTTLRERVG
ncbi:MAG TPA: hypothetical protein VF395_11350 [Polyangiaceae bacterium]